MAFPSVPVSSWPSRWTLDTVHMNRGFSGAVEPFSVGLVVLLEGWRCQPTLIPAETSQQLDGTMWEGEKASSASLVTVCSPPRSAALFNVLHLHLPLNLIPEILPPCAGPALSHSANIPATVPALDLGLDSRVWPVLFFDPAVNLPLCACWKSFSWILACPESVCTFAFWIKDS